MTNVKYAGICFLVLAGLLSYAGAAQSDSLSAETGRRIKVNFPPTVRDHFLTNMRDHLAAVSEIQHALSSGDFDRAADIARRRLGMAAPSAMACRPNKVHQSGMPHMSGNGHMSGMAQFMPEGMREAGRVMHRAADQFAADAKSRDYRVAAASMSRLTQACVACHDAYKVRE